jgi:hypothetical protein
MPAWTAPRTWVVSEVVTAALMNTHIRDNLLNAHYEYGTTLPATPSDGQLAILVDSTTAPTYRWTFRFNSAISANKWEFIGGTPMVSAVQATLGHANVTTYRFSSTLLTVPRAGLYDTIIHSQSHNGGGGALYTVGVAGAADDTFAGYPTGGNPAPGMYHVQRRTLAASDVLSLAYRVTVGSIGYTLTNYSLRLIPVQVA